MGDNNEHGSGEQGADKTERLLEEKLLSAQENKPSKIKKIQWHYLGYSLTLITGMVFGAGILGIQTAARLLTARGLVTAESVQRKLKEQKQNLLDNRDDAQRATYVLYAKEVFERNGIGLVPMESNNKDSTEKAPSTWLRLIQKNNGRPVIGKIEKKSIPLAWNVELFDDDKFGDADHLDQTIGASIQIPSYLNGLITLARAFDVEAN